MSISVKNISYQINKKTILNDISFEINPKELLFILGPNGSGKTSLIKIIAGDISPTIGDVYYDNILLQDIDIVERAKVRSVMSQSPRIVFSYTVLDILEMGWIRESKLIIEPNFKDILFSVAEECEIKQLLDRKFNTLSGGEKRRVHFARTLIQLYSYIEEKGNKYILLDEPTANLDLPHELALIKTLVKIANKDFAVAVVIHDLNLAYNFADKVLLINQGRREHYGHPEDVFKDEYLSSIYSIDITVDKKNKRINYY